ncbi:tetratricopeptide repeat protein, partial [Streptomyces sp. NPDC054775]
MIWRMRWRGMRWWVALFGPLFFVLMFTVGPAVLNIVKLPGPNWVTTAVAGAGGVLLLVATPLMQTRLDALTQQSKLQAERARRQEAALEPLVGSDRDLPFVREVVDRALLGIHPAIPLPSSDAPGLSAELPTYVPRDVDADLHTALRMASISGGFVLLVGPAASGKTRCAYEAINAVLNNWRLCIPATAGQLTALVDSAVDLRHTVVWLDEMQDFLGTGRLTVETVRRLLADRTRPVVLVGTIWPSEYTRLSTSSKADDGQDLNRDSREILKLARRFSIRTFSNAEQDRARNLAQADPRLREAVGGDGDAACLTEVLAAVPELIHRWEQADDPFGAAVVSAGVDARLCGHPEPLPVGLLEVLATCHLTGAQRAGAKQNWFTSAVHWACVPVRGSAAPLTPEASQIGHLDGYRVTDVLVQHAQRVAELPVNVPESQWELLIAEASPAACLNIGLTAFQAGLHGLSERAWRRAAEAGDTTAMDVLGVLLARQGEYEQARPWLERAAQAGNTPAVGHLGILLVGQGEEEQGRSLLKRAAEAGHSDAMAMLGMVLARQGEKEQGRLWLSAAEAGNSGIMTKLAAALIARGEHGQEPPWLERAVEAGDSDAMSLFGALLASQGEYERARPWLERAAEAGDSDAMAVLGVVLASQGEYE